MSNQRKILFQVSGGTLSDAESGSPERLRNMLSNIRKQSCLNLVMEAVH